MAVTVTQVPNLLPLPRVADEDGQPDAMWFSRFQTTGDASGGNLTQGCIPSDLVARRYWWQWGGFSILDDASATPQLTWHLGIEEPSVGYLQLQIAISVTTMTPGSNALLAERAALPHNWDKLVIRPTRSGQTVFEWRRTSTNVNLQVYNLYLFGWVWLASRKLVIPR